MEENLKLLQDIMVKSIKITTTQKQDVSFEFYPSTQVLSISVYFNGKCANGLTKSWSVNVNKPECLNEVLQDLNNIEDKTTSLAIEDDFLG